MDEKRKGSIQMKEKKPPTPKITPIPTHCTKCKATTTYHFLTAKENAEGTHITQWCVKCRKMTEWEKGMGKGKRLKQAKTNNTKTKTKPTIDLGVKNSVECLMENHGNCPKITCNCYCHKRLIPQGIGLKRD